MDINQIATMSRKELMDCVSEKKKEIAKKLENGETEPKFSIGAGSYTVNEWDRLIARIDKNIEAIKEEQEQRNEQMEMEALEEGKIGGTHFVSILDAGKTRRNYIMEKINGTYKPSFPYAAYADGDTITYNGVVFTCDSEKNAICLGDMSDRGNVLTIPLEGGGSLMVNRDSIGMLAGAMSMFSPEDANRIMRAIVEDKKAQETQQEIEDDKNSLGDDADEKVLEELNLSADLKAHLEQHIADCEKELDDDAESIITNQRYAYINSVVTKAVKKKAAKGSLSVSDKIDQIVTNRILALPIFAAVMFCIYAIAMGGWAISIGTMGTDWANDVLFGEWVPGLFDTILGALGMAEGGWLYGLIQDGIVAGVGAVLGFVPQMLVLFLLLAILEDVGYMARVAFIMDRLFRRFGLSGKSFIPMLVATGCGVPGIMASRTIEQDRDRKMTIMTTGFIPCGAKMPIIGLFAGAVFGGSSLVATSAFFIGIAAVVISGIMLKKFKAFAGEPAPFVMELPAYHAPSASNVLRATWERGWSFIKRAGTVILLSTIVLWFLQGYGFTGGTFGPVEDNNTSLLAAIGNAIAWIFYPLGWTGDMAWKATVASFVGLTAKENVVATLATLYGFAGEVSENGEEIWAMVGADFGALTAYSFMIFNLLCAPCFAAMGAIKREMNNARWTAFAIGYMCVFAYVVSLIVYQLGGLVTGEAAFGLGTVVALVLLAGILFLLFRKGYQGEESTRRLTSVAAAQ